MNRYAYYLIAPYNDPFISSGSYLYNGLTMAYIMFQKMISYGRDA